MPLLHNPMLDATPAKHRATPAEEQEMLRWAKHGVTRVAHVLNETNTRVLSFEELCTHHPNLVGRGATRDCVRRMIVRKDRLQPAQVAVHPIKRPTARGAARPVPTHTDRPPPTRQADSKCR